MSPRRRGRRRRWPSGSLPSASRQRRPKRREQKRGLPQSAKATPSPLARRLLPNGSFLSHPSTQKPSPALRSESFTVPAGASRHVPVQTGMAFKRLKSLIGLSAPPGEDPAVAKTWILAHPRLHGDKPVDDPPARAADKRARDLSPHGRVTAPALWRLTCLAAKALLVAIMPVPMLHPHIPAALRRHLLNLRGNDVIKQFQPYVSAHAPARGAGIGSR